MCCKGTAFLAVIQYLFALSSINSGHRNDGVHLACLLGGGHIALYLRTDNPLDRLHRVAWLVWLIELHHRLHDGRGISPNGIQDELRCHHRRVVVCGGLLHTPLDVLARCTGAKEQRNRYVRKPPHSRTAPMIIPTISAAKAPQTAPLRNTFMNSLLVIILKQLKPLLHRQAMHQVRLSQHRSNPKHIRVPCRSIPLRD